MIIQGKEYVYKLKGETYHCALDVTMEAQIIHLLRDLRLDFGGTILVVTHHLGVVAELCDRVYVMYAGEVVEEALVDDLFHAARHP